MTGKLLSAPVFLLFFPAAACATDGLDCGDTAWMIVSTALVMMMTPAGLDNARHGERAFEIQNV